jgi:multidrug efflux pump subunit AcrA (membrane-fusion protein)
MLKRTFMLILALLLLSAGCHPEEPASKAQRPPESPGSALQPDTQPVEVQVTKPIRRDLGYTVKLPANIAPLYQTTLYAKVSGYLKWIGPDKGDPVMKDQVVSIIDAPEIEDQYLQAAADYKIKKITFERLKNVWKESPERRMKAPGLLCNNEPSCEITRRCGRPTTAPSLPALPIPGP